MGDRGLRPGRSAAHPPDRHSGAGGCRQPSKGRVHSAGFCPLSICFCWNNPFYWNAQQKYNRIAGMQNYHIYLKSHKYQNLDDLSDSLADVHVSINIKRYFEFIDINNKFHDINFIVSITI
nr:hypothetical protein [Acidiphilium sp. C61]